MVSAVPVFPGALDAIRSAQEAQAGTDLVVDKKMGLLNGLEKRESFSVETMGFSQQWGFPLDFPLNQTSYPIGDDNNPAGIFRILTWPELLPSNERF